MLKWYWATQSIPEVWLVHLRPPQFEIRRSLTDAPSSCFPPRNLQNARFFIELIALSQKAGFEIRIARQSWCTITLSVNIFHNLTSRLKTLTPVSAVVYPSWVSWNGTLLVFADAFGIPLTQAAIWVREPTWILVDPNPRLSDAAQLNLLHGIPSYRQRTSSYQHRSRSRSMHDLILAHFEVVLCAYSGQDDCPLLSLSTYPQCSTNTTIQMKQTTLSFWALAFLKLDAASST